MLSTYYKLHNKFYTLRVFLIILGLPLYGTEPAQIAPIEEEICLHPLIKTRLLYQEGSDLSMPVLNNPEDKLELRFDYLGEPELDFAYSMVKCRYNWELNELSENEYLDGFNQVRLYQHESSRNTTRFYTHYHAVVPDEDTRLLASGNYLLRIHDASRPEVIYFTKRFALNENRAKIDAQVTRPDYSNQELRILVHLDNIPVRDPLNEIKLVVVKNYDWNQQVPLQSPPLLRDGVLHYDLPFQLSTPGANEFHNLDAKNVRYIAPNVDSISYRNQEYQFYLTPDEMMPYKAYFQRTDLNGRSYIDVVDSYDRYTEADYVRVHFYLKAPQPLGTDVYIYGALTDWKTNTDNYMTYQPGHGCYETSLLLKQGLLNFAYATRDYDKNELSFDLTEGSHDETENDYQIFIYLREAMGDFDRLIGYQVINSNP